MRETRLNETSREQGYFTCVEAPRNARSAAREIVVAADIFPECRLEKRFFFVVTAVFDFFRICIGAIEQVCRPSRHVPRVMTGAWIGRRNPISGSAHATHFPALQAGRVQEMAMASCAARHAIVVSGGSRIPGARQAKVHRRCANPRSVAVRCDATPLSRLPRSPKEQVAQAADAVKKAAADGKELVSVEFNLPLIGATDLDDWPGGVRQQYQAIAPMCGELLKTIGTDDKADIRQRVVEDADAVVVLTTEGSQAMVFPTAETLPELKNLAGKDKKSGPLVVVNSQIRTNDDGSNLISDLGFGPWKKKNEEFLAQFEMVYWLSEQRIQGETVRLLKSYQQPWQLFVLTEMTADMEPECVQTFEKRPTYKELEKLLMSREGSVAAMSIIDRVKREAQFNATSVAAKPNNIDMD